MTDSNYFDQFVKDLFPLAQRFQDVTFFRLLLATFVALVTAYFINRLISKIIPGFSRLMVSLMSRRPRADRVMEERRLETTINVATAVLRILIIVFCLFIAWRLANSSSAPIAIIGASTAFVVLGAATIGLLLRDLTIGTLMIVEKWYNVGDHIAVDPFLNLSGVVEEVNLRSTKLRSLNGEIIWLHNQHIQAVRVTPQGVRTISIDTFVSDLETGRKLVTKAIKTMPVGPTMIASPLAINEEEELGGIWRITATGQTAPGREWLIEDFAVNAISRADKRAKDSVIVHEPIVRYTDSAAEKRFVRSIKNKTRRSK